MNPSQQHFEAKGVPGPPMAAEDELEHTKEDYNPPPIPGKAALNHAVGKAVGGTVIATDIPTGQMPQAGKTFDPTVQQQNVPPPPPPQQEQTPPLSPKTSKDLLPENNQSEAPVDERKDLAEMDAHSKKANIIHDIQKRTPGSFPIIPRIGWLDAYKRLDGPSNEFRDKSIWMEEFASSVLFGSFWHNAAAVIIIPIVCYISFKLGGGMVTLILIIAFGATYYKNSIRRFRRNARDDITRELIKNTLENDAETTEWINNFMSKFWLIYEPVLSATIVQTVDSILVDATPAFLDSIRLTTFTLGTKAPRVENIKSFPKTDPDVVLMDWRLSFTPTDIEDMTPRQLRTQINPKICLSVRLGKGFVGASMPILVEDMSFRGHIRLKLKLMSNFPHVKTLDFCFLQPPDIDYVLKPVGGDSFGFDIAHVPGLHSFIRDQLNNTLGPMMYAPNVYTLDVEQMMSGSSSLNSACGVIQFTIYNAKDLKNVEKVGTSDPYCKIRLGNRPELASTAVKMNTLNPIWNETYTILVNNLNEVISIDILDKDNVRKDRAMGQANFDLKTLEEEPIQDDIWCKILRNGKERGSVRVRAAYFPVQPPKPSDDGKTMVPVESNSGILAINIAQAKDIARTGKTKSACVVYLNGNPIHTTKNMRGANPAWSADIDAFITDLESAQLTIDVVSEDRVIGTYPITAKKLIKDTNDKNDWGSLSGGEGTGKIKINGTWKPILMGEDMNPTIYRPPIGIMRVQMFAGRHIRNVDIGNDSDPYVVITGDRGISRGRTKTIMNNLNPEWNEIFYVTVNSTKQIFEFECWDYQKVTKDRTLGMTEFSMSELVEELPDKSGYIARPKIDRWAPLKQKDGREKGEIHYELSFFPSLKVAEEATEAEKAGSVGRNDTAVAPHNKDTSSLSSKATAEDYPFSAKENPLPVEEDPFSAKENPFPAKENPIPTKTVETTDPSPSNLVDVARAPVEAKAATLPEGTVSKDHVLDYDSGILVTTLMGGEVERTNTYCEFFIDSDSSQYTSQSHKSRSPKWNEVADIFVKELEYAKLVITVREKSSMDKDPIVGVFTEHVRTLLETTPAEGATCPIRDKHNDCGSLRLKFGYIPVPIELMPRERLDNMGTLTVTLVKARDLIAADRSGTSDPYVIFKLNGTEVHKSQVIKKTLNPDFNETFVVPISSRADDLFTFEIFDWNQVHSAKSLGIGSIDLANLQLVLPNRFNFQLKNKHNKGEIEFKVKFMPEFLSSTKKPGFTSSFIGGSINVGKAGVGAVANAGYATGHGAFKGVTAVGKGVGKGVGTVGKGVGKGLIGGISAGTSALFLHHHHHKDRSDRSDMSDKSDGTAYDNDIASTLLPTQSHAQAQAQVQAQAQAPEAEAPGPQAVEKTENHVRPSSSEATLHAAPSVPRGSIGSAPSRTSLVFENGELVGEPGGLTIQVLEAEGLTGIGKHGTSDPYVRVSMNGKNLYKTKVKKENLSPNWNETAVINNITGHSVTIQFLVRDHNTLGSDKDMGEFNLPLWDYIHPQTEAHPGDYRADFWAPLSGGSGRLHLILQFEPAREGGGTESVKHRRGLFSRK
ncbi:hypothetical protein BGZ49_010006 [Haplosporangium sp. Z 27]|nr:hypothetical protein BGZ49_010006 [Haplosporangium sp. Z 27]